MKKYWMALFACAFGCSASVYAQDSFRVNIPFDFQVANANLSTGRYSVHRTIGSTLVNIRRLDSEGSAYSHVRPIQRYTIPEVITGWQPGPATPNTTLKAPQNKGLTAPNGSSECSVVFKKYGNKYFLAIIWTGYQGHELVMSQSERALQVAGKANRVERVMIAGTIH